MEKDNPREEETPTDSEWEPAELVVGPDGAPMFGAVATGQPSPAPAATADNMVCLRGPCRHYWHLVTMADAGNPDSTWGELGMEPPRRHHHVCLVNPGYETSFADDCAYDCNRWDPIPREELVQITARREDYFNRHPEHRPKEKSDVNP